MRSGATPEMADGPEIANEGITAGVMPWTWGWGEGAMNADGRPVMVLVVTHGMGSLNLGWSSAEATDFLAQMAENAGRLDERTEEWEKRDPTGVDGTQGDS